MNSKYRESLEETIKYIRCLESYVANLEALLKDVSIEKMGGFPDLFYPKGYDREDPWGDWDETVTKTKKYYRELLDA